MRGARGWIAFAFGLVLALAGRWFDLHPLVLPGSTPERVAPTPVLPSGEGPIALWLGPEASAATPPPRSFGTRDWGFAWTNLLGQEFGAHRIEAVPEPPETQARVVVLTAGAARAAENAARLALVLEDRARSGATIVIEMPPAGPLADLAGLAVPATPALAPAAEPLVPGPQAPRWIPPALASLPAPTVSVDARAGGEGMRVLLRRGAYDALTSRPLGDGAVIGVAFDLGRLLASWQQGTPGETFAVASRWSLRTGVAAVQSLDLVAEAALLDAAFPFADLVERLVADEIRRCSGLPGWWPIPAAAPGGFVLTHDEEAFGDRAIYQAEYAAREGAPTTFFVIPGRMTAAGAERLRASGAEIALHWDRGFPEPRLRKIGVGPFQPLAVREGLAEQQEAIARLAAPEWVVSQRLHGLLWGADWAGTFRALAAAGLRLDSSLGPTGEVPPGFPFGTALPFHPLDDGGRPFLLWEVPFTFQDDEKMERGDTARLLAANGALGHGLVVPIFHSRTMEHAPSVGAFEEWLEAPANAAAARHWRGSFRDLLAFLDARDAGRLEVEACSPAACALTARAAGPGQALQIPAATAAGPITACRVDGAPRDLAALPWPDAARVLLPIDPGPHRVEIRFGGAP